MKSFREYTEEHILEFDYPEENPFAREVFCIDASDMRHIEHQMSLHGFRRMYNLMS